MSVLDICKAEVESMRDILVAYPSKDTALKLRSLLECEGFNVTDVCATGASVLSIAQEMSEGVIVCAESLRDMTAGNIAEHLPPGFDIVALTRGDTDSFMSNLVYLPLPVDRQEFLSTVSVLVNSVSSFTRRKDGENEVIAKAKLILREVNGFSEMQAHKYLQRESMKMGKKIATLAQEIINDFM